MNKNVHANTVIAELKKPGLVFVDAKITDDDYWSVQAVKADLIFHFKNADKEAGSEDITYNIFRDSNGNLHIG